MSQILVIEDDKEIAQLIAIHLKDEFHDVQLIHDGHDGFLEAANGQYNLIILDLMLPGMGGLDICRMIRQNHMITPVLMLTSKSEELDKVLGLEIGADDYMTKPFSIQEFKARVKALLRRHNLSVGQNQQEVQKIYSKDLMIDLGKHQARINDKRLELTPKEFELLSLLAKNPGKTFTRAQLLQQVWGSEFSGFEHTVNTHINRLRTKLESNSQNPEYILTTWGVGYRFNDEE